MKIRTSVVALSALLSSGIAIAHDGVHLGVNNNLHQAAEPLLLAAVVGAAVLLAVRAMRRGGRPDEHRD